MCYLLVGKVGCGLTYLKSALPRAEGDEMDAIYIRRFRWLHIV